MKIYEGMIYLAVVKNSCLRIFPLPLRDKLRKLIPLENYFHVSLDMYRLDIFCYAPFVSNPRFTLSKLF